MLQPLLQSLERLGLSLMTAGDHDGSPRQFSRCLLRNDDGGISPRRDMPPSERSSAKRACLEPARRCPRIPFATSLVLSILAEALVGAWGAGRPWPEPGRRQTLAGAWGPADLGRSWGAGETLAGAWGAGRPWPGPGAGRPWPGPEGAGATLAGAWGAGATLAGAWGAGEILVGAWGAGRSWSEPGGPA